MGPTSTELVQWTALCMTCAAKVYPFLKRHLNATPACVFSNYLKGSYMFSFACSKSQFPGLHVTPALPPNPVAYVHTGRALILIHESMNLDLGAPGSAETAQRRLVAEAVAPPL